MKTRKLYTLECDKQGNLKKANVSSHLVDSEVDAITMHDNGSYVVFRVAANNFLAALNLIAKEFSPLSEHEKLETLILVDHAIERASASGSSTVSISTYLLDNLRRMISIGNTDMWFDLKKNGVI